MEKYINIELSQQEQEDFEKIISVCRRLTDVNWNRRTPKDTALDALLVRSLLGDDQQSSLLYRAGFTNMRFLDTAHNIGSTADFVYGDNVSNYNITGSIRFPLLIKRIENNQPLYLSPLYTDVKRINQSTSIGYNQWYLQNRVYVGNGMELNRQNILQLFISSVDNETAATFSMGIVTNSGVYHNGKQVPFADNPLREMAEEIIYEVVESLRIEGILQITDAMELANMARKSNELFFRSLYINNYRLYKGEQNFDFLSRFTVLIGDNATGKTTILDAMRIILDAIIPPHHLESNKSISTGIPSKFSLGSVHREISEEGGLTYSWPVEIRTEGYYGVVKRRRQSRANRSTKKNNKDIRDAQGRLPLIVYCGVERTRPLEKRKIEEKFIGDRYDAYLECLNTRTTATYLKLWLRDLQQNARHNPKSQELLSCFINAVCGCLRSENIVNIQYVYQEAKTSDDKMDKIDDIILTQRNPENGETKRLLFGTLSAGYRVMVGMITNLAYRCIMLNPELGKDAITGTSGIVLIDEIDMHLHPLWQRHIVEDLMRCFPKVQFIATTHSPFVIQSLKSEQVYNLKTMEYLGIDPHDNTLDVSIENMDVAFKRSESFIKRNLIAKQFLEEINSPHYTPEERDKVYMKYAEEFSEDPTFLAKLQFLKISNGIEL